MKFIKTTRKVTVRTAQPANPLSQKFVDRVKVMLEEHGISDDTKRGQISYYLLNETKKFYNQFVGKEEMNPSREQIEKLTNSMKGILNKNGVETNEEQEMIIVDFFTIWHEIVMEIS